MNNKGQAMAGTAIIFLIVLVFVGAAIYLIVAIDVVPAGHVGVKERFGIVDTVELQPGMHFTGFFTNTRDMETRIQKHVERASAASKDLQIVTTEVALNFNLQGTEAAELYKSIGVDFKNRIINPAIQESVKAVTAKYNAEELITQRSSVKRDIMFLLEERLGTDGLQVQEISITEFEFSEEFDAAIESKQIAEQKALEAENKLDEMEFTAQSMKLQQQVVEIKKLDIQEAWIEKWDGQLPLYMGGNSESMLVQMPELERQQAPEVSS